MVLGVNIVCSQILKCCIFPRFNIASVLLEIKMSFKYSLFTTVTFFSLRKCWSNSYFGIGIIIDRSMVVYFKPIQISLWQLQLKMFTSKGLSQVFDNVTLSTSAASSLNWCFHYSHTLSLLSNLVFINFSITFHVKDRFNYWTFSCVLSLVL